MAILDFLGKNKENSKNESTKEDKDNNFAPKSTVVRGPGGKFVSQKKVQAAQKPKEDSSQVTDIEIDNPNTDQAEETKTDHIPQEKALANDTETPDSIEEKLVTNKNAAYGPFFAPFAGRTIQKFYMGDTWYFCIQELIELISADPTIKSYPELKKEENFKKLFEKKLKVFDNAECAKEEDAAEILREIIRAHKNVHFPGSLFSWLEDISQFPYEPTADDPIVTAENHQTNL